MSDLIVFKSLVERLRDERIYGQTHLRHEAADEIERLRKDRLCRCADEVRCEMRAEIERLRAALRTIARREGQTLREGPNLTAHGQALFARAALKEANDE